MNPAINLAIPIGCFARLMAARARRRRNSAHLVSSCSGCCAHVSDTVWNALDAAYPDAPVSQPVSRQALAALFAPLMAAEGWRFCRCYVRDLPEHILPEHRFIAKLVDTADANSRADALDELHANGFFIEDAVHSEIRL